MLAVDAKVQTLLRQWLWLAAYNLNLIDSSKEPVTV